MKQWISVILLVLCGLFGRGQSMAQDDFNDLSPEDKSLLGKAVQAVDDGLSEVVVSDFDCLAKKYPDNYIVQYERLYNLYQLGRYDEIIKKRKFLLKHKFSNERTYQLIGNSYDLSGNRKEAAKVYLEGLKRFPASGALYLELGNLSLMDSDYQKALEYYNKGIVVQPDFASNYYRAARLYLSSENGKVWGLVYAESAILLAPSNESRHEDMAAMMIDCLKRSITINLGDSTKLSVKLVPDRGITIDKESGKVYLAFPGIYEGAMSKPLMKLLAGKIPLVFDIPQLIDIRRGAVESYFSVTDNIYGNSMYLLEFQKKVIEAGHWDAYNYFLFMPCYPDEFETWYASHRADLEAFIDWFNNAPYRLGDGRSVDPIQIFNSYRPVDLIESFKIQAGLLAGEKDSGADKENE